jgi:hypothetical protein
LGCFLSSHHTMDTAQAWIGISAGAMPSDFLKKKKKNYGDRGIINNVLLVIFWIFFEKKHNKNYDL